ncbi:FecCD family ABC transporter permease [Naumannella halotolerans]|uniref:Iron complex transport system permease protein n=1 Tax=Naumannella halotolerans TaxID=993414 RepID=A0A4V3ENC3_9ACTN|nr:iron chelate uptake ABC transporter family permease subunit [Naumannella halotolerans]TDT33218.1 iron complex transport system permease protein [Naumannella halotolerans]
MSATVSEQTLQRVAAGRRRRARRRAIVTWSLLLAVALAFCLSLLLGRTFYSPAEVLGVILGHDVPGAGFTVGTLRLPRAVTATLVGLAFGLAGATFQTMLRNPLASPDIIGITSGASAAAVIGILVLSLAPGAIATLALVAALATALIIYVVAYSGGVANTRLILVGIGISAMLDSVVLYVLSRAAAWDLQVATRWLTGNLNGATYERTAPLAVASPVLVPLLLLLLRNLETIRMGDQTATALGVRVEWTRLGLIVVAVALMAFATAAAGPISFVAFLSGPIAARLLGPVGSPVLTSGLVGALLVLVADFAAQYAFGTKFPVGMVTGALGAPFLVYLLVRTNRAGGSL